MYDSLKNWPGLLNQLFHKKSSGAVSQYEQAKSIARIREGKGKKEQSAKSTFFITLFDVYQIQVLIRIL